MKIAVISHVEEPSMVVLTERVAASGREMSLYRPFRSDPFPDLDQVPAVIVLGGPQAAYDQERYPYLRDEVEYLAHAHQRRIPVLGICLGFQLLAEALGGQAVVGSEGLEYGMISIRTAAEVGWPPAGTYYSFHTDTAHLPEGAEVLSQTDRYVQAWRLGSSSAIQFHPELDATGFDEILAFEAGKLAHSGVDVAALRSELADSTLPSHPSSQLFDTWLASLPAGPYNLT